MNALLRLCGWGGDRHSINSNHKEKMAKSVLDGTNVFDKPNELCQTCLDIALVEILT